MFAVLHLPDFALQALLRTSPDLAARPVALLDGERKRALVTALTPAARAAGVESGLTAPAALARCADLLLRQRQPTAEAEARAALLGTAASLSPLVEDTALGVATADVTALPAGQRQPRLHAALARLGGLGFTATAGLAPTPLLAFYAASLDQTEPVRVVTNPTAFLAPLPLAVAEPTAEQNDILQLWGVRTLGALTQLSKADVAQRLGPTGLALWERAAGQATRPIQPLPPPQTFAAELELEDPIETLEPLLFLLRRFVDRLAHDLQAVALVAAELDLTLTLDNEQTHQRTIRLPEPTADPDLLLRTLQSHLDTVQTDSAVVAARLFLHPTRALHRQHGLFDSSLRDPNGFAETLARTAALLGSDRVGTPQPQDTHRPDVTTLVAPAALVEPTTAAPALPAHGLPLRRFRPPLPARVELQSRHRVPAYLWTENITGPITAHHGPWRASGDWWQADHAWARQEWDIALGEPHPGLYRLTETPTGWYLDGEYD
ncbi:DNA polymerase Y family protein [Synoicihabitans lomoniglobus]|uniref:DNA polymerase Y family protein n=1 Tax=Synoicihabitans lomoniglobus TaxID=2909285 RepID=A0AAF0CGG3_9BACT|nr:DNA polymerase Y family protein [Opitutaceae bacterium LMO-M01]WED63572.1 DNA polymerase Y family protein [Opitutaceae bacterium LMO-M01]